MCYDLIFVSPQNSAVETYPEGDGIRGDRGVGGRHGWDWRPHSGRLEPALSLPSSQRHKGQAAVCDPEGARQTPTPPAL